jgi:gluconokinase
MLIVLMGVSGSGKSTIGRLLADRLGWPFLEADEFHPPANRAKLSAGTPLTDEDRWPWLDALNVGLLDAVRQTGSVILACSALKDAYRDRLDDNLPPIRWVHLTADPALLEDRLQRRVGHFSSAKILPSQLETLEPPADAVTVRVDHTPAYVVEQTARALGIARVDPRVAERLVARHLFVDDLEGESEVGGRKSEVGGQQRRIGAADSSLRPPTSDFRPLSPGQRSEVAGEESFEDLVVGGEFRLERIVSHGSATSAGEWLSQDRPEWVALLTGRAQLRFERDENPYDLAPGDAWLIPAWCRHRVEETDPDHPTVWLAVHWKP